MDILKKYLCRFLKLWIIWFWFFALDGLGLVIDTFVPAFSPPRWLYWLILAIGFLIANVKLFAEVESEKQLLQSRIDEFEDTRADIRFKKVEDFCYAESPVSPSFDERKVLHHLSGLYEDGLPVSVKIGARLKGMKRSPEAGELTWEIVEANLPPLFALIESHNGWFEWPGINMLNNRIDDWEDTFKARYELPIEITEQDPHLFAPSLSSLGSYHVVIQYRTIRGIDSESKPHSLILEGDFQGFRDDDSI